MRKIFMVGASAAASVLLMTGCNNQEYQEKMVGLVAGRMFRNVFLIDLPAVVGGDQHL